MSDKPKCMSCGEPFIPNILKADGRFKCSVCIQVDQIVDKDWDKDFLNKLEVFKEDYKKRQEDAGLDKP